MCVRARVITPRRAISRGNAAICRVYYVVNRGCYFRFRRRHRVRAFICSRARLSLRQHINQSPRDHINLCGARPMRIYLSHVRFGMLNDLWSYFSKAHGEGNRGRECSTYRMFLALKAIRGAHRSYNDWFICKNTFYVTSFEKSNGPAIWRIPNKSMSMYVSIKLTNAIL